MSDTLLTQHPLSAVFPAMTDVAFAEFGPTSPRTGCGSRSLFSKIRSSRAGIATAPAATPARRPGSNPSTAMRRRRGTSSCPPT